jgi:hypothetical protein
MQSKKTMRGSAKVLCAMLAVGSVLATGCNPTESLVAALRTSAQNAVQDKADELVQDALDSILGGVIPDTGA